MHNGILVSRKPLLLALVTVAFAFFLAYGIATGNIRVTVLGSFLILIALLISFKKTYEAIMGGIMCYLFFVPWQSSGTNVFQTWGLPSRGILGYRVGEHVLVFLVLLFVLLIPRLIKSKWQGGKRLELPMLTIFMLFLALGSISSFKAYDPEESFFVVTSRAFLPAMCVFYITYICTVNSNKLAMVKFLTLVIGICALYGVFEYLIGGNPIHDYCGSLPYFAEWSRPYRGIYLFGMESKAYRITSTFGNPEFAASAFGTGSLLSIGIANLDKNTRYIFLGTFLINSLALMLTFTRGGMLSYLVALSLFAFFMRKQPRLFRNVVYIIIMGSIIYMLWGYLGEYTSERLSGSGSEPFQGILHRLYGYPIFMRFIELNPFFGIGLGSVNFRHAYGIAAPSVFSLADTLDNAYLSLISGMGLVSLIPIFMISKKLKNVLSESVKNISDEYYPIKVSLASAIIAILISFLFYDGLYYLSMNSLLFILVGISFSYYRYQIAGRKI